MYKRLTLMLASLMLTCAVFAAKDLWVIDPGHGGTDWGCKTRKNREKDITLAIAKEVGRLVKREIPGVRIVYTRERDTYPSLPERCHLANTRGAALFLSIHVNDAPNTFAHGTESYFATNAPLSGSQAGKSELLALLLQRAYLEHGRGNSRGVKQREWYVCEHTNMPSVLTEVGFLSNLEEERFMASKEGQGVLARAIVDALKQWRDITKNGAVPRQKLRNLRFQYFDPKQQAAKSSKATKSSKTADNSVGSPAETPATASLDKATSTASTSADIAQTSTSQDAVSAPSTADATPADASKGSGNASGAKGGNASDAKGRTSSAGTYFAIQIFSVSSPLKSTDKRLRGLKNVSFVEADGRYKALHGHVGSYADAKKLLADVRKLFPDAFIVAYDGDCQIPTSEAISRLKNKK